MVAWTCLSDVNEDVLLEIASYGLIEDVVSKERVSTVFGAATLKVLQKMKTIRTKTRLFRFVDDINVKGNEYVPKRQVAFQLLKRMPQLIDGRYTMQWEKDDIEKLASINQSIQRFDYDMFAEYYAKRLSQQEYLKKRSNILTYIEAVKVINPSYTAEDIDFEFPPVEDVVKLVAKYPDLKIKIETHSSQVNHELFRICYHHDVFHNLDPSKSFDHVKRVTISDFRDQYEDLRLLTNMEHLQVIGEPFQMIQMYPFIVSKLKSVWWWVRKWPKEYIAVVKRLIESHPLESLILEWREGKDEIINSILNSPMNTLRNVMMALNNYPPNRDPHAYIVFGRVFEFTPEKCRDLDIMRRTLLKFRKIRVVKMLRDSAFYPRVIRLCRQIECSNRNRSLKVIGTFKPSLFRRF